MALKRRLKSVGFTDAALKARPDEPTGLALRGLAATLQEDSVGNNQPRSVSGKAKSVDFTVRKQFRVVRSTSSAELNGFVGSVKQVLLLHMVLHLVYCGTPQSPEEVIDLLEDEGLYPRLDFAVDARAFCDAVVHRCVRTAREQFKVSFGSGP